MISNLVPTVIRHIANRDVPGSGIPQIHIIDSDSVTHDDLGLFHRLDCFFAARSELNQNRIRLGGKFYQVLFLSALPRNQSASRRLNGGLLHRKIRKGKVRNHHLKGRLFHQKSRKNPPAVQPPSTQSTCPVTYPLASDAKNSTAPLTSFGCPARPMGIWASRRWEKTPCLAPLP